MKSESEISKLKKQNEGMDSSREGSARKKADESNYEIITDLRDTINMLNERCDEY